MHSRRIFAAFLFCAALARADGPQVTRYDLYAKGLHIGTVRTERSRVMTNGEEALKCDVTTHVAVNLLVIRHHLDQHEVYVSNGRGPLAYEETKTENGKTLEVRGERSGADFVFHIEDNGVARTNVVRDGDYDVVGMDGPEIRLEKVGAQKTWRVLDMGGARIVERTYAWVRDDDGCRVIDYSDPFKSGRRWVKTDDLGLFVARQDGKDKAGSYSMRLINEK